MDIEDFVTGITNINVKEYLEEAVKSYNSGSYRACITYTWLAVFMDINQKIEQLSVLGEQEALNIIQELEKIRKDNNIQKMLVFERDILKTAKEKFSLFDDIAMIDLERIQEDRNRSVHPLLSYEGVLYKPTAEQARTHIINAYTKLLNEPNVFGKSVIERLFELIYSKIFPLYYDKAKIVLNSSYLKSPKESLLRNFIISLLKQYLKENLDFHQQMGIMNALKYLLEYNRGNIENVIADKLPSIIDFTNNNELLKLLELMRIDIFFYSLFFEAHKILIKNFIENCPPGNLDLVADLIIIPDLTISVEARIYKTERKEFFEYINSVPFDISKIIRKAIVKQYVTSYNYDLANTFASVVIATIPEMEKDELLDLIKGIANNGEVSNSFQVEGVIRKIKSTKMYTDSEFIDILNENGIGYRLPST